MGTKIDFCTAIVLGFTLVYTWNYATVCIFYYYIMFWFRGFNHKNIGRQNATFYSRVDLRIYFDLSGTGGIM